MQLTLQFFYDNIIVKRIDKIRGSEKMFKTETHLHVSEVSRCAQLSAAEMVRRYKEAGYSTVFVTDHFKKNYLSEGGTLSWEEQVDKLLCGYENARVEGEAIGVSVLFGVEIQLVGTPNHYLLYGIEREHLLRTPEIFEMEPQELYAYAKQNGITVVQAHPYRDGVSVPMPDAVDALEAINANPRHAAYNEKAVALAEERALPVTSGSDAHRIEDVARGGVMTEEMITSTEDYVSALLRGELRLIGEI